MMDKKERTVFEDVKTYEAWDEDYYQPLAQRHYDRAIARLLSHLKPPPGGTVLDAGCGPGEHSIRIARSGFQVHAIDFSEAAISEGQRRAKRAGMDGRITFEQGDLTKLRYADESYDTVICWGVVIHIPSLELALDELMRVVRSGGRIAFQITNDSAWDIGIERLARWASHKPISMETLPLGAGHWYEFQGNRLWVWRININAISAYLETRGFRRIFRGTAEFTELHRRLSGRLRSAVLYWNDMWFGMRLPSGPACTNLLVFEKAKAIRG